MCREHGSVGAAGPPTPASTEEAGDGRIVGRDIHRDFAEAVGLEDGVCRQLGPIESTRDRLEAFADTGQPIDPVTAGCMGKATAVWSILLQKVVRATGPRPGAIHIPRRLDADYPPKLTAERVVTPSCLPKRDGERNEALDTSVHGHAALHGLISMKLRLNEEVAGGGGKLQKADIPRASDQVVLDALTQPTN